MNQYLQELTPQSRDELASLLESRGQQLLTDLVAHLRDGTSASTPDLTSKSALPRLPMPSGQAVNKPAWSLVGEISKFDHKFPADETHEHYENMQVYECRDDQGLVRFAVGCPKERGQLYGRERGWLSIWSVVNGSPRELRTAFVECDDFSQSGERAALIYGKDGNGRAPFSPEDRYLLPSLYSGEKVDIQRDRCHGPYAKNRLALIATDEDLELMLNHALHNARVRG